MVGYHYMNYENIFDPTQAYGARVTKSDLKKVVCFPPQILLSWLKPKCCYFISFL